MAVREEIVEIEISDDDILYYIDDEKGNEIGFAVEEDGKEVEYYYEKPVVNEKVGQAVDSVVGRVHEAVEGNSLISREEVSEVGKNLNAIAKDNKEVVDGLREAAKDMKELTSFLKHPFGAK